VDFSLGFNSLLNETFPTWGPRLWPTQRRDFYPDLDSAMEFAIAQTVSLSGSRIEAGILAFIGLVVLSVIVERR
jgi:hypothetical protein